MARSASPLPVMMMHGYLGAELHEIKTHFVRLIAGLVVEAVFCQAHERGIFFNQQDELRAAVGV